MDPCIFCKIVAKNLEADVVYEDDDVLAFRDIHPKYSVHILVIPKQHLASVADVSEEHDALVGKLLRIGAQLAENEGVGKTGFRLLTNTGPHSGQIVGHLHIHLLGGEPLRPI